MPESIRPASLSFSTPLDLVCQNTTSGAAGVDALSVFFSRKLSGFELIERHPEAFEEAKRYEKTAVANGSPFTWADGKSLDELSQPDRIAEIQADHERRVERLRAKTQPNPLRGNSEPIDIDEIYGQAKVCLACHK